MKNLFTCLFLSFISFFFFSCAADCYKSVTFINNLDTEIEITEISGEAKQAFPSTIKANESENFEIDPSGEGIEFTLKIDGESYFLKTGYITDCSHFELKIFRQNETLYFRVNKHAHDEKLSPAN